MSNFILRWNLKLDICNAVKNLWRWIN